jgi:NADH-quinone oxidoreductase subunit H
VPAALLTFIKAVGVLVFQLSLVPVVIWFERKVSAYIQDRTGPNRANILGIRLAGLVHPIADVVKLVFKEDLTPPHVRRFYYLLAPFATLTIALLPLAVVPFADEVQLCGGGKLSFQVLDLDVGLLWILAVGSFGVFGIVFAGWGSNNKYAMLAGMRASAQMISYELAMGLSIVGMLMVFGTVELNKMVQAQGGLILGFLPSWGLFLQPLAAIIFFAALLAEANRNPFDLPEGESEIVGFHVEYSSMKFASFFVGEYAHIVGGSAIFTTLFLGGWQVPWLPTEVLRANTGTVLVVMLAGSALIAAVLFPLFTRWRKRLRVLYTDKRKYEADVFRIAAAAFFVVSVILLISGFWRGLSPGAAQTAIVMIQIMCFGAKVVFMSFTFIWIRWTLPRFRYDQLMSLGWKNLVPLGILNVFVTGLILL